jgi:hypothetical protein
MAGGFGIQSCDCIGVPPDVSIACMLAKKCTVLDKKEHLVRKMIDSISIDKPMPVCTPAKRIETKGYNDNENSNYQEKPSHGSHQMDSRDAVENPGEKNLTPEIAESTE